MYSPKDLFLSNLPVVPARRLVAVLRQLFEVACKLDFYLADIFHISSSICMGERKNKGKGGEISKAEKYSTGPPLLSSKRELLLLLCVRQLLTQVCCVNSCPVLTSTIKLECWSFDSTCQGQKEKVTN